MAKILSFDISSSSTGYCLIKDGRLMRKTIGVIVISPKLSHGNRLSYFEKELIKLITEHKPDVIVIEDIFKGPSITVFKLLAMFRGVCFKVSFDAIGMDPLTIMPTEARKMVGSGITKEDAFSFVIKKYKLKYDFIKDNDRTDAIVLALAATEANKAGKVTGPMSVKRKKRKKRKKK